MQHRFGSLRSLVIRGEMIALIRTAIVSLSFSRAHISRVNKFARIKETRATMKSATRLTNGQTAEKRERKKKTRTPKTYKAKINSALPDDPQEQLVYLCLYERGIKSVIRRGAGFRGAAHATAICGAINKRVNAASFARHPSPSISLCL